MNGYTPRISHTACWALAITLFAAAQSLREALVSPTSRVNQSEQPHLLAARAILGEPTYTRRWEESRALTQDEALHYALQPPSQ